MLRGARDSAIYAKRKNYYQPPLRDWELVTTGLGYKEFFIRCYPKDCKFESYVGSISSHKRGFPGVDHRCRKQERGLQVTAAVGMPQQQKLRAWATHVFIVGHVSIVGLRPPVAPLDQQSRVKVRVYSS